jgi:hypothetical protein
VEELQLHRLLAWASQRSHAHHRDEPPSEDLRARLTGLREETVQLRDQLSLIAARRGVDADALPRVYERLANMLALIGQDGRT